MGQSAPQTFADNLKQLNDLTDEADYQIRTFKKEWQSQVAKQQMIDTNSDIRVLAQNNKTTMLEVNAFLKNQYWGSAGQYAKKNFVSVIQSMLSSSSQGQLAIKKGFNLITTRDGALARLIWMIYNKSIIAKAHGETTQYSVLTYYYATYIYQKKETSIQAIKSLVLASSVREEDRKETEAALMCDMMGICPVQHQKESDDLQKKKNKQQLLDLVKQLTIQGNFEQAASILEILKQMQAHQ